MSLAVMKVRLVEGQQGDVATVQLPKLVMWIGVAFEPSQSLSLRALVDTDRAGHDHKLLIVRDGEIIPSLRNGVPVQHAYVGSAAKLSNYNPTWYHVFEVLHDNTRSG